MVDHGLGHGQKGAGGNRSGSGRQKRYFFHGKRSLIIAAYAKNPRREKETFSMGNVPFIAALGKNPPLGRGGRHKGST
jgi:hypothetical protein